MNRTLSLILALWTGSFPIYGQAPSPQAYLDSLTQVATLASRDTHQIRALYTLGGQLRNQDPPQAIVYLEEAIALSEELGWEPGLAQSLLQACRVYRYQRNYAKSISTSRRALALFEQFNDPVGQARACYNLGETYFDLDDPLPARTYFQQALDLYQMMGNQRMVAEITSDLGWTHSRVADYAEALRYQQASLRMYQERGDQADAAKVLLNIAILYSDQSDYPRALDYYEQGRNIFAALGDSMIEGQILISIGSLHSQQRDFKKAGETYLEAMELFEAMGQKRWVAITQGSLGAAYRELQQVDQGIEYLNKSLIAFEQMDDSIGIARMNSNLGSAYLLEKQYDQAFPYLNNAMSLIEEIGEESDLIIAYSNLAEAYAGKQNWGTAETYAKKALEVAQAIANPISLQEVHELMARIYAATNRPDQALASYQRHMAIRDSIFTEDNVREVARTEMRYAFQRQQLADSLANVQQQAATELAYQQQLSRRTYWLVGAMILALLGFLFFRYRQQVRNRERELELQQERTRKAQLQELDALKSRFFTNISHEFRTPLTVMMGMAGQLPPEQQQASSLIRRNGQRLLRLINQLLDLSRLESQELKLHLVQGDLLGYLRYISESFQSLAQERRISLRAESDLSEYVMDYDAEKVQDIAYNLLANALKFTPEEGEVVMNIAVETGEEGERLRCSVRDTGPGILPEELPRIFDRFYQGSATAREGSTGIGLSLAKALVERMGGGIEVQSEVGKGATFSFWLPADRAVDRPKAFAPPSTSTLSLPEEQNNETSLVLPANPDQPQILLIEDNADVITYLGAILGADYQLLTATDGQAGIELAQQHVPDLIISDVMMPHKDGFEVTETLKTDARTSHIPIILLTAKATQADKLAGLTHGADAYLTKPFDREELMVRMENLLQVRQNLQTYYRESLPIAESEAEISKPPSLEDLFLQTIRDLIQDRLADPELNVHHLCDAVHLSHTQTYRKLKALTGQTPTGFIRSARLKQGRHLLETTNLNVSEVAYDVGFNDPGYFSRVFFKEFGMPPSDLRQASK